MSDDLKIILSPSLNQDAKTIEKLKIEIDNIAKKLRDVKLNVSVSGIDKINQDAQASAKGVGQLSNSVVILDKNLANVSKTKQVFDVTDGTQRLKKDVVEVTKSVGVLHRTIKDFAKDEDTKITEENIIDFNKINQNIKKQEQVRLKRQEEISDTSRKMTYDEQQERLKTTTNIQKNIEKTLLGSNETIADRNKRITKVNANDYEQIWHKAFKDKASLEISEAEKTAQLIKKIELYKEKMTGGAGFTGELDIFASKQKGKFDPDALTKIRTDVLALNKDTPDLNNKIKQLNTQFSSLKLNAAQSSSVLLRAIENAAKFLRFYLVGNFLISIIGAFKNGVGYVAQLDNSLNEIMIVTGKTQKEVDALGQSYNELAKEMSVTTKELVGTAADLFRQGLTEDEVETRMKGITQYAKISAISLEESNKIITATANATGESVQKIIDIFAYLGDTTAAGAEEIGEALQRVASASENSNVSLEKSASWISTISSITRESASTIGRSLNTMISRYESIKSTGFNSEDATKLNDVVKALSDIGITATDSQGQLLDFSTVVDLLGAKFSTLSKNEKSYIATTMFGTFQRNRGITLLNNYSQSLENYENALNSAGVADEKFNIYQKSTQAYLDKLKSTIESIQSNSFDSQGLKELISFLTVLLELLSSVIKTFGLVAPVIFVGSNALMMFTKAGRSFKNTIIATIVSLKTFNSTTITSATLAQILGNAFNVARIKAMALQAVLSLGVSIAITALVEGINKLVGKYQDLNESQEGNIKNQANEVIQITKLSNEMQELTKKAKLTVDEKEKLLQIERQIAEILPSSVTGYDNQNVALSENLDLIRQLNKEKKEQLLSDSIAIVASMEPTIKKTEENYNKLLNKQKEMRAKFEEEMSKPVEQREFDDGIFWITQEEFADKLKKISAETEDARLELEKYNSATSTMKTVQDSLNGEIEETPKKIDDTKNALDDLSNSTQDYNTTLKTLQETMSNSSKVISEVNSALDEYNDTGKFNIDTIIKLAEKYPQLLTVMGDEKAVRQELIGIIENEQEVSRQAYIKMIEHSEDFYNAKILGNAKLVNELNDKYGIDLNNFKSLAKVKEAVEVKLIKSLASLWSNYYDTQGQFTGKISLKEGYTVITGLDGKFQVVTKEMMAQRKAYQEAAKEAQKRFDDIALTSSGVDFSKIGLSGSKSGGSKSGGSGSSSKEKDAYVTDQLKNSFADLDLEITQVSGQLSQLDQTSDKYRILTEKLIKLQKDKQVLYSSEANSIRNQLKNTKLSAEEIDNLNNRLRDMSSSWWSAQSAIDSANKSLQDAFETLQNNAVSSTKDFYKKQEKEQLKSIKKSIEAENNRHKNYMDNLEERMKKFEESINQQLNLIDELSNEEDFQENLSKLQTERQELEDKISLLSLDNSIENKEKLVDLRKELADKTKDIDKLQNDRTKQIRKDNLKDQLDTYKKDYDGKKEAEDLKYNTEKDFLDMQQELVQEAYSRLSDILSGSVDDFESEFVGFKDFLKENETYFTDDFTKSFIAPFVAGLKAIQDIKTEMGQPINVSPPSGWTQSSQGGYHKTINGTDWGVDSNGRVYKNNQYYTGGDMPEEVQNFARSNKGLSPVGSISSSGSGVTGTIVGHDGQSIKVTNGTLIGGDGKTYTVDKDGTLRDTNGKEIKKVEVNKYADGGIISKPTLAMMGEAGTEAVFNKFQLSNLFNMLNNPQKYMIPRQQVPSFAGANSGGGVNNNYHLELKIASLSGTKESANMVFNQIVTGLKKMGK